MAPGRQSVFLHLTSSVPATFSAQLCVPDKRGCTPVGQVHSLAMVSMFFMFLRRKKKIAVV